MIENRAATAIISRAGIGTTSWTTVAGVTAALLLGVFIIFGMGFAGAEVMHNAAHDMRHGIAFPCH